MTTLPGRVALDDRSALLRDAGTWVYSTVHLRDARGHDVRASYPVDDETAMIHVRTAYLRAYTQASTLLSTEGPSRRQRAASERAEALAATMRDLGITPALCPEPQEERA